jgi:uncharacterized protein (UPF0332 family)
MSKTKPQQINPRQIKQFFTDAQKRAIAARKNLAIDAEAAYEIAYEAMIKGSLSLMLSHGQRPRKQLGHHIAIIEFVQKNLPRCPATMFTLFDRMRRKRNDAFYDVTIISDTEAQEAVSTAEQFLLIVETDIKKRIP